MQTAIQTGTNLLPGVFCATMAPERPVITSLDSHEALRSSLSPVYGPHPQGRQAREAE